MAGSRGPIPKRSGQRRRRNKPEVEIDRATGAAEVLVPDPDPKWHEAAVRWYESLAQSGQSIYFEPSDWAVAESMSRDLKPQVVGVHPETGRAVRATVPINGAQTPSRARYPNGSAVGTKLTAAGPR